MEILKGRVAILGINGHLGHQAARAFLAAGWEVAGFGRSNKYPVKGVDFVKGHAESVSDLARAIKGSDVVLNSLNLPYDKWGNGASEALMGRVIEACGGGGKTLLFPGNIYGYRAHDRCITPELRQEPETERGAIRIRMEQQLARATREGKLQAIVVRAGNFYGSELPGDWFGALVLREASKNRVCLNPRGEIKVAWAYLPDLADAFVKIAQNRDKFSDFESFHFAGHFVNADETFAAMKMATGRNLSRSAYPWLLFKAMGLFMPVVRGLVQMRYLWENEMELRDERHAQYLGEDPGTPFDEAISRVCDLHFKESKAVA